MFLVSLWAAAAAQAAPPRTFILQDSGTGTSVALDVGLLHAPGPRRIDPDRRDTVLVDVVTLGDAVLFEEVAEASYFRGSTTWVGRNPDRPIDELQLTIYDGRVAGYINVAGREVSIQGPLGGELVVVVPDDLLDDDEGPPAVPPPPPTDPSVVASSPVGTRSLAGPFAGYDAVVDLLVVYGQPAVDAAGTESQLIANIISGVATANQALAGSLVNSRIRLLDTVSIEWDSSWNVGMAKEELQVDDDGYADFLPDLRDAYGADLVAGIVGTEATSTHPADPCFPGPPLNQVCGGGGTGAATTPQLPGPDATTSDLKHVVSVRFNQVDWSLRHEIGHAAGLRHSRAEFLYNVPDYAFGYNWPDSNVVTDPATLCTDEGFRTIMSKTDTVVIGGVTFETLRGNGYSSLDYTVSQCGGTKDIVAGTSIPDLNNKTADSARRLAETLPVLADYRPAKSVLVGAEISSPPAGAAVGTSATTFSWNAASPVGSYWLEVYDPATQTSYADTAVTTTSEVVSGLPGIGTVLAVRLWTNLATDADAEQWVWVDHRYNNDGVLVSCVDDPGVSPAHASWQGTTCPDSAGAVCSVQSGVLTCDLIRTSGTADGEAYVVSDFYSTGLGYDLAIWGNGDNDEDFCCLYHDPGESLTTIEVKGTMNDDWLSLVGATFGLGPTGAGSLEVVVTGKQGVDWLIGSSSTAATYSESLRGGDGNDRLIGNDGDDDLRGGADDDYLFGGDGDDTLIAGQGSDELFGDRGSDTLCTQTAGDQLHAVGANNTLYISSTATGSLNTGSHAGLYGNICGHTIWPSGWAGTCSYSLTQAPAACAAAGIPD